MVHLHVHWALIIDSQIHNNCVKKVYVQHTRFYGCLFFLATELKLGRPPLTRILFSLRRVSDPIVRQYCK